MKPPDYVFDAQRLAALDAYDVLDTADEAGFDDIVQIAASLCEAPVALVSFVARDRQWFKARLGLDAHETDLPRSVCAHALVEPDLLVIEDLAADPRTRENPLVAGLPHIRFYAGAPLRTAAGAVIGTLCVIDTKPRPGGLDERQKTMLRRLARQVMSLLELRKAVAEREALLAERELADARRGGLLALGERLSSLDSIEAMLAAAAEIVGETLDLARAGYGRLEDEGEAILIAQDWTAPGVASVVGRHRFADYGSFRQEVTRGIAMIIDDVSRDPRTADHPQPLLDLGIRSMVNMPITDHGQPVAILFAHAAEPRAWPAEAVTFLRNVADRVEAGVARVRAEAHQRVLNEELGHRLRNTFAMVQALAGQTLKGIAEREPVLAFDERLRALGAAHEILEQTQWNAASLAAILRSVLGALARSDAYRLDGPPVAIGPRATLSISMLIHELATNAIKYGALSRESGSVAVTWQVDPGEIAELVLEWVEQGGPPAAAPARQGFGSRLIGLGLVGSGGADLSYREGGLEARFRAPLAQVQAV